MRQVKLHKSLAAGQPVTKVVLGGSVTAGVGVIDQRNSWVARLFEWISTTFPHVHHKLLNQACKPLHLVQS